MSVVSRRGFLKCTAFLTVSGLLLQNVGCMQIKSTIRKIKGRLKKRISLPPEEHRSIADLPEEGIYVSVEKALNSRCTSDYDDDPSIFHWGMFDKNKKLSDKQILNILSLSKIPRFTQKTCEIRFQKNMLSFIVDPTTQGIEREILMIESGMQQQAVGLVCSALGVGTVIKNMGVEGKLISNSAFCTVRMKLEPMKPSYDGLYWTTNAPKKECPWLKGNLPNPRKDSSMPLITAISSLCSNVKNNLQSTITPTEFGQVLWAAKGRTPHFFKSIPWGLTIPTWDGLKETTSIYLCNKQGLYKYNNWEKNRPTHAIVKIPELDKPLFEKLKSAFKGKNSFVMLINNDARSAFLWEMGYSLINIHLQLHALSLTGETIFPKKEFGHIFDDCTIGAPPVLLAI